MGASSSSQTTSTEQQEQESIASTSPLSLPSLHSSFSLLSQSPSSPPRLFSIKTPKDSNNFFSNLSRSIYSLLFPSSKDPITWVDFLKGYNRCCTRMPASDSLNLLLRVYYETCLNSEIGCKLEFDNESEQVGGVLSTKDLLMIFHMCWVMDRDWRVKIETADFMVPEFTHLVLSVMVVGGEIAEDDEMVWDFNVLENEKKVSVEKFRSWVLSCAPGILNCLSKFVIERIKAFGVEPSPEAILLCYCRTTCE